MPKPILFVVGPTGVGKTVISIRLAQSLQGEIISADSMQVYKSMDVGTAKVTADETKGVRHHLIDVCEPSDEFSVYDYCEKALAALEDIESRGRLPIVVGGTGLYIRSLIQGLLKQPSGNEFIRNKLEKEAEALGSAQMHEKLKAIDPARAQQIHPNQLRRIIRALEIFEIANKPASVTEKKTPSLKEKGYQVFVCGITMDRQRLYDRINHRVDLMIEAGLLDEVKKLSTHGISKTARQAVGYKEILDWMEKKTSIDQQSEEFDVIVQLIKQKSRNLAKRQWTWFKREENITWFDYLCAEDEKKLINLIVTTYQSQIK